jgi:hypothetical protein
MTMPLGMCILLKNIVWVDTIIGIGGPWNPIGGVSLAMARPMTLLVVVSTIVRHQSNELNYIQIDMWARSEAISNRNKERRKYHHPLMRRKYRHLEATILQTVQFQ